MKNTLLVNMFAGPGSGKSTMMAGVFAELKFRKVNCEMAPEFAKEKVWLKEFEKLNDQRYIFEEQHKKFAHLIGQVDVVVTDSPLLLSIIYDKKADTDLYDLAVKTHNQYNNLNYFILRGKHYNPQGRIENNQQAIDRDYQIEYLLKHLGVEYLTYPSERETIQILSDQISRKVGVG